MHKLSVHQVNANILGMPIIVKTYQTQPSKNPLRKK